MNENVDVEDRNDRSQELALGFTINLPRFKVLVPQASNWINLGLDPYASDFGGKLLEHMNDAATIHFDLTGMREINTPEGVLYGPAGWNPVGSTHLGTADDLGHAILERKNRVLSRW